MNYDKFQFAGLLLVLYLFCKGFHKFYDEPEYFYLRKILGMEFLCIGRGTAPIINLIVVLIILPVCKTFNKFAHLILSKLSSRLLSAYLENIKVLHQCLSVTLVFVCGNLSKFLAFDERIIIVNFSYSLNGAFSKYF